MPDAATTRLRQWQVVTVATLFTGYAGYYVCRSVLPVASNGMMNDPASGIDAVAYGRLGAVGIYLYAAGSCGERHLRRVRAWPDRVRARNGAVADRGRVLPASRPAWGDARTWGANRFVQSMGWGALVKIQDGGSAGAAGDRNGHPVAELPLWRRTRTLHLGGFVKAGFRVAGTFLSRPAHWR